MGVLTTTQIGTLQRVLAGTNNVLPALEMIEAFATVNPALKGRAEELRAQREYLVQFATTGLEVERQIAGSEAPKPRQMSTPRTGGGPMVPGGPTPGPPVPGTGPTPPGWLRWLTHEPTYEERQQITSEGHEVRFDFPSNRYYVWDRIRELSGF